MSADDFKNLMMELFPAMRGWAFRILGSDRIDDIEDVLQETAAALWNKRLMLAKVENPKAYVMASLRNRCLTKMKSSRLFSDIAEVSDYPDRQSNADEFESVDLLSTIIGRLPEMQRKVISLSIYNELDYNEIALRLNLSRDNVRQLVSRARRSLREAYLHHLNPRTPNR